MDDDFLGDFRTINWSCFLNFTYLDSICEVFTINVETVAEKQAPLVTFKIKGKIEAWVTDEFFQAIKERNFLKKQTNKTKSIIDWTNFTQKRNQVNNIKHKLKQEYFNKFLINYAKRSKQF